ncbi:GTPase [Methylomarinovum caldicuralii]|uniref:GTPase HflX n=1 Tax=Methylomarinovum caldicuralii TaxID=438856 RepID=A0AAU9CMT5_9GAMM|nr:ribosome rescue GTPase HflX [Methylomarinovum caldicuralii]BCX80787.1 GTPase [Methylomarinovum caldicuralii]
MQLFERPGAGERAVLVHIATTFDEEDLAELDALARAAGAEPVATVSGSRQRPDPRFFIGRGKLEQLRQTVAAHEAELVLFNHALSPSQERNLERELKVRVVDRTGLILDIFAQRARSYEGKLQVELAQLRHLSTRLVRGWTHLERQKGGIGLRGPGETQLETDRRLIGQRIRQIRQRLERVDKHRAQGRSARRKADLPTIALVGYTNAGKSTLFNALTGSGVYAADQLFATLDSTLRRIELDSGAAVLADTVGFIRHLPHELVAAFRSTLQETCEAEVVLHVIDASHPRRRENIEAVYDVLDELGVARDRVLEVYNQIDRLDRQPRLERDAQGRPRRVWLSAATGAGLELLKEALAERLGEHVFRARVHLLPAEGCVRARLFRLGKVLRDEVDPDGGWNMEVELPERHRGVLSHLAGYNGASNANEC